jgi:hypothetical protein
MPAVLNPCLKPPVTVAASRSVSVVRPDASSLPASEARAASVAVAAVQTAFPQEGYVGAGNARSEEAPAAVAQAHCGWAQAGCSAGLSADDLNPAGCSAGLSADDWNPADCSAGLSADDWAPAGCSAGLSADDWNPADYSALASSEQRRSLEPRHDSSDGYKSLPFVSPARPRGR